MPPDRKRTDSSSLATAASDQIRTIIEAAEQTAAQIRADAEAEAATIRRQAEEEAGGIRSQAEEEASGIRSQARGDVQARLKSIRNAVSSLSGDLEQLEERLQSGARAAEAVAPEPVARAAEAVTPEPAAPAPEPPAREPTAPAPVAPAAEAVDADAEIESARLVALNMALDGASREDVDRYLSENFDRVDAKALLDDVYASIAS